MTAPEQLSLPTIPGTAPKPRTRHRYAPPAGSVWQCRTCAVQKRYAATGSRQGARMTWSKDGGESWQEAAPECFAKRKA